MPFNMANKQLRIVILVLLMVACIVTTNKNYKKCFEEKCQDNQHNRKCCHLGTKLAKRSYDCTVDGVISTQTYLRSLKHNIHSMSTLRVHKLFNKVKRCKRFDECLQCCCQLRKQRVLGSKHRGYG